MERDNIPLELLWEETCESTLAVIGQLAITGQRAHPEGLKVKSQVQVGYTDISSRFHETDAVGTILTDRPPHRSAQARLRMRLL